MYVLRMLGFFFCESFDSSLCEHVQLFHVCTEQVDYIYMAIIRKNAKI